MLSDDSLTEVWCETYDDIVLVWRSPGGAEVVEFTQVKNEALPSLYSTALLTDQDKKKAGTSLFERSLARDTCTESVRFRLVTMRDVNPDLRPLLLNRDDGCRATQQADFDALYASMKTRGAGAYVSPKSNGLGYWIERTIWEVHSQDALVFGNQLALLKHLESVGIPVFSDTVEELYQKLLWRVKDAAEKKFLTEGAKKIIKKSELAAWLREQSGPLPDKGTDAKLKKKLGDAKQPPDTAEEAVQLRRTYNQELRRPSYLTLDDTKFVGEKVQGVLFQLRTKMDGSELPEGAAFHSKCVDSVIAVKDDCGHLLAKPTESMLLGCMYDITSRCRHRFMRPTS